MKKISLLIGSFVVILSTAVAAHAEFSGNVAITTDYRVRGISQGDRSPAVQGGFDIEHESGLYIGTWASHVTFSGGAVEMDYYAGFGGSINEVSYDVGGIWYNYPEDDANPDLDYFEAYGSLSIRGLTLGLAYSPDYFAETGDFIYIYGDYGYALADHLSLDVHFGWNLFNTVGYQVDIGIINAKMVWYTAVINIVAGHVFAVYIAHLMAIRVFTERDAALRSQIPMLVLMVAYTMISLWVMSQPIVN